jgi:hypothetical protein
MTEWDPKEPQRVILLGLSVGGSHRQHPGCTTECGYIVEQHQRFEKPEESDVPEFTIEVAYKTKGWNGIPLDKPGYRFVLKWQENGEPRQVRSYGYATKDFAMDAAKVRAKAIALEQQPVHVETYRPEL